VQFYLAEGYEIVQAAKQTLSDGTEMDCYEMTKSLSQDSESLQEQ
jgi:hypothetical protein